MKQAFLQPFSLLSIFIMQHFFLFLFVLSNISLASESSNGDGLYEFGNLDDPLSDVSDCNSAFDSWDVPNDDTSNQNENTNLDMFSQSNAGDTNTDLIAAGCPPTDGLGARDQTLCPNNQIITPELPTLDTLEKLAPSASPDEKTDTSEETHPVGTGENGICPPLRPINLCCICEAQFQFTYCQDCLPSKPPSYSSLSAFSLSTVF